MAADLVARPAEAGTVGEFLDSARIAPAALLIDGEPGIGKTTLWSATVERARERGYRVLAARVAAGEPVSAYTSLADLLSELDPGMWIDLPHPQRVAMERVLSRDHAGGAATDHRAVAAAFLSIVDLLTDEGPVLLAIDDLQWLDPSSLHVIAFAARRLAGPVGVLGAIRSQLDDATSAEWLQLPRPDAVTRIQLRPLSIGALHTVLRETLGRSLPRPAISRIHATSGGNPFYAIELARALDRQAPGVEPELPGNLAELVRARIGRLGPDVHEALLAASCLATPTVEFVSTATISDVDRVIALLEDAEAKGIIAIEGNRVRFTHPLLASGVYTDASEEQRRAMHRRLATIVDEPELRARHLALASTRGDTVTLEALDEAAELAHQRGAPAAAAELLELAMNLGGDTPQRRIRLATHYFDAADPDQAGSLLEEAIARTGPGAVRAQALSTLAHVRLHDDGHREAARLLQAALAEQGVDLALRIRMLTTLAYALFNTGQPDVAHQASEEAVVTAEQHGNPGLISQALAVRVMLGFLRGDGVDEASMQLALELDDPTLFVPIALRPTLINALLLDWTGQLERGYSEMRAIQRRCTDVGEEGDLVLIAFYAGLNTIWRGEFADAHLVAEDAMERARQLSGDFPRFTALILRAWLAAFAGREDVARQAIAEALAASERSGSHRLAEWVTTGLGFLEVSLGNWEAALAALQPLLTMHRAMPDSTEIVAASFMPDAVEALIELGRADEAEQLADALERNGHRLGRAWMLAVGARCRAMVLAARGDMTMAVAAAQRSLTEHDRLPMPFERARTQLLLGRLSRRRRNKDAAIAALRSALTVFDELDAPLWAERARAELARVDVTLHTSGELTAAELRVAQLAASGMTNRDVAGALFISPKTVEATLARAYRKLGIHSRAELGRSMGTAEDR
ncbi:MAG TPA: AAA family ATPase [Mycobacterium sp.]|nr:AAA family ATPase [Mycobacterium sp.]